MNLNELKKYNLILVAACSEKGRIIGNKGQIPWKINGEQKRFRELTEFKTVVMGRKTHEDIGRPLPNRTNVVLSKDKSYRSKGVLVVNSIEEFSRMIVDSCFANEIQPIFIIGGQSIYEEFLPYCKTAVVSYVEGDYEGDAFFPEFEGDFESTNVEHVESNINYKIVTYRRKK